MKAESVKLIPRRCIDCGNRVQWMILGINVAMFVLEGSFAVISNSRALLTDAFQSLANVVITIVVMVSLRMAAKGADERYPYGYGKAEFLASGIVNTLLMLAALVFIVASFAEMAVVAPEAPPKFIAIAAAVISIIANYIAFRYGRCAGETLGSSAIMANAMVSRADVGTSLAVIVAVVGSNLGLARLDHIVAIAICIMIITVTLDGVKKAIKGLMDVSLHSEESHIRDLIEDVRGVQQVGAVKARLAGRLLWVDADVFLSNTQLLGKGLEIVGKIKDVLHRKIPNISQVSVQLLPVDSESGSENMQPGRLETPRSE